MAFDILNYFLKKGRRSDRRCLLWIQSCCCKSGWNRSTFRSQWTF